MKKDIVINATSSEIRVAITEDERLAEIFLEVPDKERHVGSIYLGRVERVVQGMNAAFIDIGEPQDAFLHFSDVGSALDEFKDLLDDKDDEDDDEDDETPEAGPDKPAPPKGRRESPRREKDQEEGADAEAPVDGAPQAKRPSDRRKPDQRRGRPEPEGPAAAQAAPSEHEEKESAGSDAPESRSQNREGRNRNDRNRNDRNRNDRGGRDEQARDERGRDDRGRDNRGPDDRNRNDRNRNDRNRRPDNRRNQPPGESEELAETHDSDAEALLPGQQELFPVAPDDDDTSHEGEDAAGDDREGPRRRRKRGRRGGRGRNRKRNDQGEEQGADSASESPEAATAHTPRETQERPAGERQENDRNDRGGRHEKHGRRDNRRGPQHPDAARNQEQPGAERGEPAAQREPDTRGTRPQTEQDQARSQDDNRRNRDRRDRDRHRDNRHRDNRNRDDRNRDDRSRDDSGRVEAAPAPAPAPAPPFTAERTEPAPERRREPQGRTQPRPKVEREAPPQTAPEPEAGKVKKETTGKNPRRARPQRGTGTNEEAAALPATEAGGSSRAERKNTEARETAPAPEAAEKPAEKKSRAPKTPRAPRGNSRKRGGDDDAPVKGNTVDAKLPTFQTKRSGEVTIGLEKGKDVIVQVTRESYASKGVRVTTKVSLPGRFLVLLPLDPAIGISRKVQNMKERRRLRRIAKSILPEGHGCIIRTVAQDKDEEVIRQDLTKLIDAWRDIEQKIKQTDKPGLLYKDQSIANTVMRDLFTLDTNRVVIDNKALYKEIRDYVEWAAPSLVKKVELYSGPRPIFDQFGIEKELQKVAERKVYIPSGGYIILDQTEAMMVIDVNSGRYAGKKDQELNSLRTNLESAREIARQIRLRDIGGLIVVDFIDLYDEKNRKKVYDEMKKEMKKDRAKSVVLPMTQFGLVQMTRQRIRQQVVQTISEQCPVCSGSGLVQSKSTVVRNIERWLQRFRENSREFRLTLTANPIIIDYLTEGEMSRLTRMMLKYFVRIKVIPDDSLGVDDFQFYSIRTGTDVTANFPEDTSNGTRKREKEKEKEKDRDKEKEKEKSSSSRDKDREKSKGQGRGPSRKPREAAGNAPAPVAAENNGQQE